MRLENKWFWLIPITATKTSVGCVMDQEEFARGKKSPAEIFEELWQVEGTDTQQQGTGLGLPITKGWTALLGGTIAVQSEVGQGSTFTIRIPVAYKEG